MFCGGFFFVFYVFCSINCHFTCFRLRSSAVWLMTNELQWSGNFFWRGVKFTWRYWNIVCQEGWHYKKIMSSNTVILSCRYYLPWRWSLVSKGQFWAAQWLTQGRWNSTCVPCSSFKRLSRKCKGFAVSCFMVILRWRKMCLVKNNIPFVFVMYVIYLIYYKKILKHARLGFILILNCSINWTLINLNEFCGSIPQR